MRVWIAEWTKAVVVFLAGGIPQGELNVFSINLYICNVVLEHGRDIFLQLVSSLPEPLVLSALPLENNPEHS